MNHQGREAHSGLRIYFDQANHGLLSAAEERDLIWAAATGDSWARDRLIVSNLRLVVKIARGYIRRGMDLEDLIGEGNLGLVYAVDRFDPRYESRFSTYASYWIKQAIYQALVNTSTVIRIPAHGFAKLTKWRRAERTLSNEWGRDPTFEEVSSRLGLSGDHRALLAHAMRARDVRLHCADTSSREAGWSHTDWVEAADEREALAQHMCQLDDRERTIISLHFGLGGEILTLREIGRRFDITREWVRQIQARALGELPRGLLVTHVIRDIRDAAILYGALGLMVAGLVLTTCLPWWFVAVFE